MQTQKTTKTVPKNYVEMSSSSNAAAQDLRNQLNVILNNNNYYKLVVKIILKNWSN